MRTGKPWYPRMVRLICERQKFAEAAERENGVSHKSDIGPGDYLSDEEVRRCRAVLSDEKRVIFELMLGSGLRPGEICQLQEWDLRIEYGNAAIFVRYGKWTKRAKRTREKRKATGYISATRPGICLPSTCEKIGQPRSVEIRSL